LVGLGRDLDPLNKSGRHRPVSGSKCNADHRKLEETVGMRGIGRPPGSLQFRRNFVRLRRDRRRQHRRFCAHGARTHRDRGNCFRSRHPMFSRFCRYLLGRSAEFARPPTHAACSLGSPRAIAHRPFWPPKLVQTLRSPSSTILDIHCAALSCALDPAASSAYSAY